MQIGESGVPARADGARGTASNCFGANQGLWDCDNDSDNPEVRLELSSRTPRAICCTYTRKTSNVFQPPLIGPDLPVGTIVPISHLCSGQFGESLNLRLRITQSAGSNLIPLHHLAKSSTSSAKTVLEEPKTVRHEAARCLKVTHPLCRLHGFWRV